MGKADNWEKESIEVLYVYEEYRELTLRATKRLFDYLHLQNTQGNKKVLEIGSGIGFLRRNWSKKFNGEWVKLDSQPFFLKDARTRFPNGDYLCASAYELPFPDKTFDVVCGFNSYDNFMDLETAVQEAARVLKSGGRFFHMMDLHANKEPLDSYLKLDSTSLFEGWEASHYFSERIIKVLSSIFDKDTVKNSRIGGFYIGTRTSEQRKTDSSLFANDTGNQIIYKSAIDHGFESYGIPKYPRLVFYYEQISRSLGRFSTLLQRLIKPPCMEISVISYVEARK